MQPYFLPYVGYWQLMAAVDRFVLYDTIQYTKKGWINRNRFLRNGAATLFSVPLQQGSDVLDIVQRQLAPGYDGEKLLRQWAGAYRTAPHFTEAMDVLGPLVRSPARNLYDYLHQSITGVATALGLTTVFLTASAVAADHSLRGEARVLSICAALGATRYVNPIGGALLYDEGAFAARGVELRFHLMRSIRYAQGGSSFVPSLSVVDALMFTGLAGVRRLLAEYDLLTPSGARARAQALATAVSEASAE